MIAMVVVVTIAVVGRYIFNHTPGWSEEMALFCFTWFGFLSASLAEYDDSHIRIQILDKIFPSIVNKILRGFYFILKVGFAIVLVVEGSKLVKLTSDSIMGGLQIPYAWLNLTAPVTGIFILLFLVTNIFIKKRGEIND